MESRKLTILTWQNLGQTCQIMQELLQDYKIKGKKTQSNVISPNRNNSNNSNKTVVYNFPVPNGIVEEFHFYLLCQACVSKPDLLTFCTVPVAKTLDDSITCSEFLQSLTLSIKPQWLWKRNFWLSSLLSLLFPPNFWIKIAGFCSFRIAFLLPFWTSVSHSAILCSSSKVLVLQWGLNTRSLVVL